MRVTITSSTSGKQWNGTVVHKNRFGYYIDVDGADRRYYPFDWVTEEEA